MARTKLIKIIALIYHKTPQDINEQALAISRIRYRAYQEKLSELAQGMGCNKPGDPPRGPAKRAIDNLSRQEARGIIKTWNDDSAREVERLFQANPRGNRNYYYKNMETWARNRDRWKNAQISLMSTQMARNLAREDFNKFNRDLIPSPLFRFEGPPPAESECADLMAMGLVGLAVVAANPTPIHIN